MRRIHGRLQIIASLVFLAAFFLATGLAKAATQAITMTPTSTSQIIQPGSTYRGSFQVFNQGETPYAFKVYSAPYHVSGEDYTPDFTVLPSAPDVKSWFAFSIAGSHLDPGQSATVDYSISMPLNTPPGGYYAAVFAETHYPKRAGNIKLNGRVGQIFYLQAAGPVAKKGEILSWQANILQKPPLTSALRLQNSGGVHYPAIIKINVQDAFGHSKYSLKTTKEVLPQTIRKLTVRWSKTPGIGLFKVTGSVSFLGRHQTLPDRWVLVMSQKARAVFAGLLALIVLFTAARPVYRRRRSRKAK